VAVDAHLRTCAACAREAASLDGFGDALRTRAARMAVAFEGEMDGLQSGIVSRLRVEREESVPAQVGRMFEDMRLGFAALGSTAASFVSLLAVVGILNFGPLSERPDSLAGVMQGMGGGSAATSVDVRDLVGQQIGVPSPQDREAMSANAMGGPSASNNDEQMSKEDAVFALAAVVTRQGRIASLEVVRSDQPGSEDREQILRLLDQVSRARFEPATVGGAPVAARRVWVMAHTTVRAKLPPLPKQSALPPAWTMLSVVS